MIGRKLWLLTLLLGAALVFAGCSSSDNNNSGGGSNKSPSPTASKSNSDCKNAANKGKTLATTVTSFFAGKASAKQVQTAATEFSDSVTKAQDSIKPQVSQNLNKAESAAKQMGNALKAQPVDTAALRSSAADLAAALGAAVSIC